MTSLRTQAQAQAQKLPRAEVQKILSELKLCGYPNITNLGQIYALVDRLPEGVGFVFKNGFISIIVTKIDGKIIKIDISDLEDIFFIDGIKLNDATDQVMANFLSHRNTSYFREYNFEPIGRDTFMSISNLEALCVTNRRDGKYCDFVMWVVDNETGKIVYQLNYSQKICETTGIKHSGDDTDGFYLLHKIKFMEGKSIENYTICYGLVGFRRNKLSTYTDQYPSITFINHDTKTGNICFVDLSEAACGKESTLVVLGVIKQHKDGYYVINTSPKYLPNEDTVTTSEPVRKVLSILITEAEQILEPKKPRAYDIKPDIRGGEASKEPDPDSASDSGPSDPFFEGQFKYVLFSSEEHPDHDLDLFHCVLKGDSTLKCIFADGRFNFYNDESHFKDLQMAPRKCLTPPIFTGSINGSVAALVSTPMLDDKPVIMPLDFFSRLADTNAFPIIFITPKNGPDCLIQSGESKVNGLYILNLGINSEIESSGEAVMKIMRELDRSGFMTAGPNSICLVMINSKLYWYQGTFFEKLLPHYPQFGEDVSDLFTGERIEGFVSSGDYELSLLPPFIPKDSNKIQLFDNLFGNPHLAIKSLEGISLTFLVKNMNGFMGFLYGCSNIFKPEELSKFILEIIVMIDALLDDDNKELLKEKDIIHKLLFNPNLSDEKRRLLINKSGYVNGKIREAKRKVQPLINAVRNLWCHNAVSKSIGHMDTKRIMREAAIKGNIEKFKKMTLKEILEMYDRFNNVICAGIKRVKLSEFLKLLPRSKDDFNQLLSSGFTSLNSGSMLQIPNPIDLTVTPAQERVLDGGTASALVGICKDKSDDLTTPDGITCCYCTCSSLIPIIAIPLPDDKQLGETCLKELRWEILAVSNETLAWFRFLIRKCLCEAELTRKLNLSISPASETLSFGLVHMFLSIAEEIIKTLTTDRCEFEDGIAETIRGLVIHIMTICGSGSNPLCNIFTLFYDKIITLPKNQNWIAVRLFSILPYTGWDHKFVKKTLTKYLLIVIKESVVFPMVKPIHDMKAELAKKAAAKSCSKRDDELKFSHALCHAIISLALNPELRSDANNIAERALSLSNGVTIKDKRSGIYHVFLFLMYVFENPDQSWEKITSTCSKKTGTNYYGYALSCAINIYFRRSGILKTPKVELCDAIRRYYADAEFNTGVEEYDKSQNIHTILLSLKEIKDILGKFKTISPSVWFINHKHYTKHFGEILDSDTLLCVDETGNFSSESVNAMKACLGKGSYEKQIFDIYSDGEVKINCFTTQVGDGYIEHNRKMEEDKKFIIGDSVCTALTTEAQAEVEAEDTQPLNPIIKTLSDCKSPALDFATCMVMHEYDMKGLIDALIYHSHAGSVKILIELLIKQTEMSVDMLRTYLEMLLMNWKNLEEGLYECLKELEKHD